MELELLRNLVPKNRLAIIVDSPEGVQYCCVRCPAKYDKKEKLEVHLYTHYKEYRFLCVVCGTGLKRKEHLDRHLLGHQEVRPHVCPDCGKGFKRKEHLNIHRAIHSGDKNQICRLCRRSFYRKDHLHKHLQTHNKLFLEQNVFPVSEELMQIKEEVDDVETMLTEDEQADAMELVETIHESPPRPVDSDRPFACPQCPKTYKRKDHLKLHSLTHLEKDKICTVCGKAYHKEEQLLNHMTVHIMPDIRVEHTKIDILPADPPRLLKPRTSTKVERPHECPICHRKFKRKQHLKVHANVHMRTQQPAVPPTIWCSLCNEVERNHECPICHRKFKRKQHLKVHANVHMRTQQPAVPPTIWCSLCNEGFHNNSQFENHNCTPSSGGEAEAEMDSETDQVQNTIGDAKKENDYPEYSEMDDNIVRMNQPIISLLEEQNIPTPQRVYICKFCSKQFKRKDHYKIHLHIHTGIKSFFCPDCGKGFYRKDHLQKHELVHLKVKKPTGTKPKKALPDLFPINMMHIPMKRPSPSTSKDIKPEITITAPSNTKLRVPLQIKVPYQMVVASDNGEQHTVTVDPHNSST